jgi:CheY-like chemotaxis protein
MESPITTAGGDAPAVLIAEDEVLVRFAIMDSLLDAGITVYEAGSAAEAIDVLETKAEIDLVFTDIRMPGSIDGLDLVHWVHDHRPDLSVVLTSGEMRKSQLTEEPGPFIAKPYDLDSVVAYIAALARAKKKARAH